MAEKWYAKDGRGPLLRAIDEEARVIEAAEHAIQRSNERIAALEALLKYAECQKCGAELAGGVQAAREMADAAKLAGREDAPCIFCDSPEQTAAMEKALEVLA